MTDRLPCDDPGKMRCKHCGRRYSTAGLHSHQAHCEWAEFEGYHPTVDVEEVGADVGGTPSESEGDPPSNRDTPQPEGVGEGSPPDGSDPIDEDSQETDTGGSGDHPSKVTDGGPQTPPTPSIDTDHGADPPGDGDRDPGARSGGTPFVDDDRDAGDLPDRYVSVDDYVATIRRRDPDRIDVDALVDDLRNAEGSFVDLEKTNADGVKVKSIEEIQR